MIELGRNEAAEVLFKGMKSFALKELNAKAKIDYFATSLPLLLVFEDDLDKNQKTQAEKLLELADDGLSLLISQSL